MHINIRRNHIHTYTLSGRLTLYSLHRGAVVFEYGNVMVPIRAPPQRAHRRKVKKLMIKKLATIGNSYGVIIDRVLLREAGIAPESKIELTVMDGAVVVRPAPRASVETRRSRRRPAKAFN